jgi:hypothetical protein
MKYSLFHEKNSKNILIYRRRHSDHTYHYLVVARVRERPAVNKQRSHRFYMESFNLKKLNESVKSNFVLRSQISLQLWKILMLRSKLIVLGKLGTLLYLLCIADLPSSQESTTAKFVDIAAVLATDIGPSVASQKLQTILAAIQNWF